MKIPGTSGITEGMDMVSGGVFFILPSRTAMPPTTDEHSNDTGTIPALRTSSPIVFISRATAPIKKIGSSERWGTLKRMAKPVAAVPPRKQRNKISSISEIVK